MLVKDLYKEKPEIQDILEKEPNSYGSFDTSLIENAIGSKYFTISNFEDVDIVETVASKTLKELDRAKLKDKGYSFNPKEYTLGVVEGLRVLLVLTKIGELTKNRVKDIRGLILIEQPYKKYNPKKENTNVYPQDYKSNFMYGFDSIIGCYLNTSNKLLKKG